jgi:succinate dehydrogenase / fumarate reductase iron-sulfur subunit
MQASIILRVAREGGHVDHEVALLPGLTVLDALETIRGGRDPDLRYRHSCHHGSCGTCGAVINGHEALMCLTRLEDLLPGPVTLEPLRGMDAVGDLAVSPLPLFAALPEGAGYLRASGLEHGGPREDDPGAPYVRFEACIECGLCVSACPVPAEGFVGPAALAMADRDREERPERLAASLAFAAGPRGVAACKKAFACSRACPQGVAPGRRIENLRKTLSAEGAARDKGLPA